MIIWHLVQKMMPRTQKNETAPRNMGTSTAISDTGSFIIMFQYSFGSLLGGS